MENENELERNIGEIVSKENVMKKLPLSSIIWARLNPVYELIASTFMKYINNEVVAQRISKAENTDEMCELLGIQSFIGRLSENASRQVENALRSQRPISEVVDFTALQVAENKRTQDGEILYRVSNSSYDTQGDILRALKKANPTNVYVNRNIVHDLEEKARKIKKRRRIKLLSTIALSGALVFGGLYFKRNLKTIHEKISYVIELKEEAESLEESLTEKRLSLPNLEDEIEGKENVIENLEEKSRNESNNFRTYIRGGH